MNSNLNQIIDLFMQGMEKLIEFLGPFWPIISFLIKLWVYIVYFIPVLGMKLLKFLNLWPSVWPFN
ncbi:MAG: hypothetical protein NZ484_00600 [Patescibacteria group bacterium]|nr:hypothetical protein [Patescibacteria group bacterium]MCX7589379.1 hypothetical protein [Patescibacteria group bacterium]MDW8279878.1 hypothetical protein [bacterium]